MKIAKLDVEFWAVQWWSECRTAMDWFSVSDKLHGFYLLTQKETKETEKAEMLSSLAWYRGREL